MSSLQQSTGGRHDAARSGTGTPPRLSSRERLAAVLAGEEPDRVPVSFWHHFPGRDHTSELLADATVEFYRRYAVDLVKLMPTGMYSVIDYGVTVRPSADDIGTTLYAAGPVRRDADWALLPAASPERGTLRQHVAVVQQVRARVGPEVPLVQTIFSPLTMAAKIVGTPNAAPEFGDDAQAAAALTRLADDVIAFAEACLAAGADGFYFATQLAGEGGADTYTRWGVPYDLRVLEALRARAWLLILHLHGERPLLELADRYPVDIVSWEDRETEPSLAEGLERTRRCLMGGVHRGSERLVHGTPDAVRAEVADAIRQTGGRHLIVAPGCVAPVSSADALLNAVLDAAIDAGATR